MFDILSLFWKWEDHQDIIPADEIQELEKEKII